MRYAGVWMGVGILLFSAVFFKEALSYRYYTDYSPGPGLFPVWLCGALIVVSILYIVQSWRRKEFSISSFLPSKEGRKYIGSVVVSVAVFLLTVGVFGYIVSSVIMLWILFLFHYKWYVSLGISLAVTLVLYYVFHHLLSVPLPEFAFWG